MPKPTVEILSPAANIRISGTVTCKAKVTKADAPGSFILGVGWKVDGNLIEFVSSAPDYITTLDTTTLTEGPHTITAQAVDGSDNALSDLIAISVIVDNLDPTVTIHTPTEGQTVYGRINITWTPHPSVVTGSGIFITHVRLDQVIDSPYTPTIGGVYEPGPYVMEFDTTTVPDGPHHIAIRAQDFQTPAITGPDAVVNFIVDNALRLGPMAPATHPEQSMLSHLKAFMPMYITGVDQREGLGKGFTSAPRSFQVLSNLDLTLEPQYPAILIISPGDVDTPKKEGNGTVRRTWELNVAAIVEGPDQAATEKLAKRYGAAIVTCIMQRKSMGDPNVRGTDFMGDSYNDLPAGGSRSRAIAIVQFHVEYDHTMRIGQDLLPDAPLDDPGGRIEKYPTLPDIDHVHLDVAKEASDG